MELRNRYTQQKHCDETDRSFQRHRVHEVSGSLAGPCQEPLKGALDPRLSQMVAARFWISSELWDAIKTFLFLFSEFVWEKKLFDAGSST